jgi:hypothetical protein
MTTNERFRRCVLLALPILYLVSLSGLAHAGGRLLATGGVTEIEGAAGGGIVPWALIAGYGTRDELGATAFYTNLEIDDFRLQSMGVAIGIYDRIELSYARQKFDLGSTVPGHFIEQDVFGAKVKLAGDAVFDQDTPLPQFALGVQYKKNRNFDFVPKLLGAQKDAGTDVYLAATKLYLAGLVGRNVLVNGVLRLSKANQLGILGFGGDLNNRYRLHFESTVTMFLNDMLAIGAEYRAKPNNLGAFKEDSFKDLFIAFVPNKHVAFTAAYAGLGQVADKKKQDGIYLSIQGSF